MNEQMKKGAAAYAQMADACSLLVESGNWQRVGASDITLFLNMYTQALLLKLAQANGAPSEQMLRFIADNRLPLVRFEQVEPTLETHFMEGTGE